MRDADELTATGRGARTMSFRAAVAALVLVGTGGVAAATIEPPAAPEAVRDPGAAEREWPTPGTIGGPPSTRADAEITRRLTDLGERLAELRVDGVPLGTGGG